MTDPGFDKDLASRFIVIPLAPDDSSRSNLSLIPTLNYNGPPPYSPPPNHGSPSKSYQPPYVHALKHTSPKSFDVLRSYNSRTKHIMMMPILAAEDLLILNYKRHIGFIKILLPAHEHWVTS